jgi:hypothetical protein
VTVNVGDLRQRLADAGVRPDAYSLDGGLPDNRYCIEDRGDIWSVYYSERGTITWQRLCANEAEACEVFLARVTSDPTSR